MLKELLERRGPNLPGEGKGTDGVSTLGKSKARPGCRNKNREFCRIKRVRRKHEITRIYNQRGNES